MTAVLTGTHFLTGNDAAAEGAMSAGCRFFAGYPITPSTEIAERCSRRLPKIGGSYIQMEDEIASMCAILGGSWAGVKSMTSTSGPGYSLMVENIGLGAMMETPVVVVNVQRGSPSTGIPTSVGQSDVMQARWGSHGDYEIIAVSPNCPQECFDLLITAFNFSEKYRVPVTVLMDECVSHMSEKVVIPDEKDLKIINRKKPKVSPKNYLPFKPDKDMIPSMAVAGEGYKLHVTGLTHDHKGYPVMTAECHEPLVRRLCDKIRNNVEEITIVDEYETKDAEIVIVAFGAVSRSAMTAVKMARKKGQKVGLLRLITIWPFPDHVIKRLAKKVKGFVVAEINYGQVLYEVERCSSEKNRLAHVPLTGGRLHSPEEILVGIKEVL
jgi:2-oxoglutarate ferredoxin oxidoreductase subunit alpha